MKHTEKPLMKHALLAQSEALGGQLARLRVARRLRQADVAVRAGIARSTAALIEKGDPRRTLGQVLRYLDAIAPGATLLSLLQESDPALLSLAAAETTRRVREPSSGGLEDLDF
jgi:transcriptional regulator with XRE-family HTH domain